MPTSTPTILALTENDVRSDVAAVLDTLGELYGVWEVPGDAVLADSNALPDVVIADSEMLASFPADLRKTLRQAATQLLLVTRRDARDLNLDDFAADATDVIVLPLDAELLALRLRRAREIRRMRSELTGGASADSTRMTSVLVHQQSDTSRLRKRVRELDRLKSNLITVIAHEFKTPIHLAAGYIELLHDGELGELEEEQLSAVRTVKKQLARLGDKVADIERIAQLEMGLPKDLTELVDIGVLIDQELDGFYPAFDLKQLKVRKHFDRKVPSVRGCADFLADVFRRLIDNAIHYTPEGGAIALHIEMHEHFDEDALLKDEQPVSDHSPQPTREVRVRVVDAGVGIPPQLLPHIFDRFGEFRDIEHHSSQRSGLGLGLAICRHLVELHDGAISVQSEEGKGSTFTVTLPVPT